MMGLFVDSLKLSKYAYLIVKFWVTQSEVQMLSQEQDQNVERG